LLNSVDLPIARKQVDQADDPPREFVAAAVPHIRSFEKGALGTLALLAGQVATFAPDLTPMKT